jgi:hypothetical protein
MARSECEEFTAAEWWPLIEWLAEQLHRCLAQLRRGRRAFAEAGPFLFHGRGPGLECVGEVPHNDRHRPHAWVSVDVRLGKPVGHNEYGRTLWERKITLEARLPEAHQRKIMEVTDWRCSDGRRRRVPLAIGRLRAQLRAYAQRRARVLLAAEQHDGHLSNDAWQAPLTPPRVWIEPGQTPFEMTRMALLLIFWHERMVRFGPAESPDAWAWVKEWTGAVEDSQLWERLVAIRRRYVEPEDWSGLWERLVAMRRRYVDPEDRHRLEMAIAKAGRQQARRGDALNYAGPLRDEVVAGDLSESKDEDERVNP